MRVFHGFPYISYICYLPKPSRDLDFRDLLVNRVIRPLSLDQITPGFQTSERGWGSWDERLTCNEGLSTETETNRTRELTPLKRRTTID